MISVCMGFFLLVSGISQVSIQSRVKKVINGELVVGRWTGYDAVRYFAAIGTLHGYWKFLFIHRHSGALSCGGALITPGIVQTACHCLSYNPAPDPNGKILPVVLEHHWEGILVVYVGVNQEFGDRWAMNNVAHLKSRKFVLHQGCGQLPKGTLELNTYDHGWISIKPNWDPSGKLSSRLNYAPVYSGRELWNIWDYFKERRPVCLVMGFGPHEMGKKADNKNLRHGWTYLLPHQKCFNLTSYGFERNQHILLEDIVTWSCTVTFSKHHQSTAVGDSGSPVTCNNLYFAIVLGGAYLDGEDDDVDVDDAIDYDTAIWFATFQNAVEYRRSFIEDMENYVKNAQNASVRNMKEVVDVFPTLSFTDINHWASFSPQTSCSSVISLVSLLILKEHYIF